MDCGGGRSNVSLCARLQVFFNLEDEVGFGEFELLLVGLVRGDGVHLVVIVWCGSEDFVH